MKLWDLKLCLLLLETYGKNTYLSFEGKGVTFLMLSKIDRKLGVSIAITPKISLDFGIVLFDLCVLFSFYIKLVKDV